MNNKYIITLDTCGVSIRINDTKLISYSYHNFNTPKGRDVEAYQRERWSVFLRRCMKYLQNVSVIKQDKLIFKRGDQ